MLVIDVSSVMYTGASAREVRFGESGEFTLRCIPYFFEKIAAYYIEDKDMVAVFEHIGKIPALASSTGYKSGRTRNPLVEWEIKALAAILDYINFPMLEIQNQESDHIINNYCRLNRDKENIIILSADADIASNVSHGDYETKISSFSTKSYNIDKYTFEEITGVPYNFMNLNKLLLGCKSDKIKPYPEGEEIFNSYLHVVLHGWKRKYGYDLETNRTSDVVDALINNHNTLESFLDWFQHSRYNQGDAIDELRERWTLVAGTKFDVPEVSKVNWDMYNAVMNVLGNFKVTGIKAVNRGDYDQGVYDELCNILRKAKNANASVYEGKGQEFDVTEEVGDISNILDILGNGGDM